MIDCVNIWKTSEAANLVFQWIFVLNSVKCKFFSVSIVNWRKKLLYFNYGWVFILTKLLLWLLLSIFITVKQICVFFLCFHIIDWICWIIDHMAFFSLHIFTSCSRINIWHEAISSFAQLFLNMHNKTFFQENKYSLLY